MDVVFFAGPLSKMRGLLVLFERIAFEKARKTLETRTFCPAPVAWGLFEIVWADANARDAPGCWRIYKAMMRLTFFIASVWKN